MGLRRQIHLQAEGKSSECILHPVAALSGRSRKDAFIVLSEVSTLTVRRTQDHRAGPSRTDPDSEAGFEAGVLPVQDGRPAGFPRRGIRPFPVPHLWRAATSPWARSRQSWRSI